MNTPPIPDPSPQLNRPVNHHELREWLGITAADFLIYAALSGAGSLYLINGLLLEITIACVSILLGFASCYLGMRHDDRVSQTANVGKKISYPACFLLLIALLYLNFTQWNKPSMPAKASSARQYSSVT